MALTVNDICIDVCLKVTLTPGGGAESVVSGGEECGSSPGIVINPDGSITIILPLVACFSITLNDDISVGTSLTSLSFKTS
ncbi:TPA: hypothetical protein QCR58_005072 [Bacillus cereus]|uniref:hypothetical protein n=1 Tax=Bacillus cereus group TaxID=86661 RepID=UPI0002411FC3|nr:MULTISPECIES: hypothetical protein [Bacillus cereus group]EHL66050.1 hypothetical protein HMPREF1014_05409 [Bacillus sp. 7_6_55CFAA_CT2]MCU5523242.1 hypothetical protein [Bacillus cereus]PFN26787.1 hypothetical protein COJ69_00945 [Bacillus cereus]TKJ07264.1 hypothetical protein FC702_05965 [Bacillus cereus]HDR4845324.1 hypothetical protein [Bacillus cereus]